MPCDSVAVVRARLEANASAEILSSPGALAALVGWLRQGFGACVVHPGAAEPLRLSVGAPGSAFEVRLSRRDGLATVGTDRTAVADAARRIETFARDLAAAAAGERLVRSIKRRYAVESDEVDRSGCRTLTVSLPT